jgi:O-antigen/teichoic acid export membrane protein
MTGDTHKQSRFTLIPRMTRKAAGLVGLDAAISFDIGARAWSLISGPITSALLIAFFTPEIQGYYYIFLSILGFAQLIDMGGLNSTITPFLAHEWSKLRLNKDRNIEGDPEALSRLVSVGRISMLWFLIGAVVTLGALGTVGYVFINHRPAGGVSWQLPWLLLCVATSLNLGDRLLLMVLDGCNQVRQANTIRFIRSVASSLVLWTGIVAGLALWAPAAVALGSMAIVLAILGIRYRRFFAVFLKQPPGPVVSWRREMGPLQGRFAITAAASYLTYGTIIPITYYFHGAEAAGRVGMTWTIAQAVIVSSYSWVGTKAPQFGILAAKRDRAGLDRLAFRSGAYATAIAMLGSAALMVGLYFVGKVFPSVPTRLLPPLPMALFLFGGILSIVMGVLGTYIRAHKQEPMIVLVIVASVLFFGGMALFGKWFGPTGSAAAYVFVMAVVYVPWAFLIFRRFRATEYGTRGSAITV